MAGQGEVHGDGGALALPGGVGENALEGTVIALAGQEPYDELHAARAAAGVLGLDPLKPRQ